MYAKIRFNLIAVVLALSALAVGVGTASGGTPVPATQPAPLAGPPSLTDFLGKMFGLNTQPADEKFNGPQLYSKCIHDIADTHIKLVDQGKRQAFLSEWEHKYDKTGMLDSEEGVDIACSEALYSLDQRFDAYLNVNSTAAEKKMIDPTLVGIGVAVAIKSTLPANMLDDILSKAQGTNGPGTKPGATTAPATNGPATKPGTTTAPATNGPATKPGATTAPATNGPATKPGATTAPATNGPTVKPTTIPVEPKISKDDPLIVIEPLEGGPAEQAGLKPGDEIVMVNDQPLIGLTSDEARNKITGKEGIAVKISVDCHRADGTIERKDFSIVRKRVVHHVVHTKDLGDGVTCVRLDDFMSNYAEAEMKEALTKAAKGKGLVFDLRGNGGGRVDAARAIISYMINDGTMLVIMERSGAMITEHKWVLTPNSLIEYVPDDTKPSLYRIEVHPRDPVIIPPDMPIAVLINGHSASASEMTSGALQFNHRARTVGENSYGKGIGQSIITLPWGRELHVTSLEFRPAGHPMDWVGILADVHVEAVKGHDNQLDAAKQVVRDQLKENEAAKDLADQLAKKHKEESERNLVRTRKAVADQDAEFHKQHPNVTAPLPPPVPAPATAPSPDDSDGD